MQTPIIKDVEALRQQMEKVDPNHEMCTDDRLIWYVCIQEARSLSEARTKDIASMFRDGITAINSLEQVQEHLDTYFEDYDLDNLSEQDEENVMEDNSDILHSINDFFGVAN